MKQLKIWWEESVKTIENSPFSLAHYALGFLAAICIETFLEIFSTFPQVPFKLFSVSDGLFLPQTVSIAIWYTHCLLWWVVMILALIIIITVAGRQPIASVARFVLGLSLIVVIVPMIDLIVSAGKGISIHYLNPAQGITSFLPTTSKGMSWGEFVLLGIMTVLIIGYLRLKRASYLRIVIALAAISAVTALLFTLSYLVTGIFKATGLTVKNFAMPIVLIRLFCIFLWVEITAILLLAGHSARDTIKKYAWHKLIPVILSFILGIALSRHNILGYILQNISASILSLLVVTSAWLAYNFNLGKNRAVAYTLAALTVFSALVIDFVTFQILITAAAFTIFFRLEPYCLNRIRIIENFFTAGIAYLAVLLGWHFAGLDIAQIPAIFTIYFIIMPGLFLNALDLDTAAENKNILAVLGPEPAKTFCALTIFIAFIALPFLFLDKKLLLLMLPAGALGAFLCFKRGPATKAVLNLIILVIVVLIIWLQLF